MVFALLHGGSLITGVDEELRRVYVGHRGEGIYFDDPPEAVDQAIDQWNRTSWHLVIGREDLAMLELKKESSATSDDVPDKREECDNHRTDSGPR